MTKKYAIESIFMNSIKEKSIPQIYKYFKCHNKYHYISLDKHLQTLTRKLNWFNPT